MPLEVPSRLVPMLFERKALLWICQRAELRPGVGIHGESEPLEEATARYRQEPGPEDFRLADMYWEACWTESVVDLFYDAVSTVAHSNTENSAPAEKRLPYRLSTDPDSEGQIDRRRFLPIYEVNGTSRAGDPEGLHGGSLARRLAYKMALLRRLEDFSGRIMVVVGATNSSDLDNVRIASDFLPSSSVMVILWPTDVPVPDELGFPNRLDVHFLRGSRAELHEALISAGAPRHTATPLMGVRYGRSVLELREEDLVGVDQDFILVQENDFEIPVTAGDDATRLERLWRNEPDDWLPFASGMVFRRHYQPFQDLDADLPTYILSQLEEISKSDRVANSTLTIPATSGSGITTALRHAAFFAAYSGYPTLICRPANQRFSVEKLSAFLTRLQEQSREQSIGAEEIPALLAFDRQHRGIDQVTEVASTLAALGRRAFVVEVIPPDGQYIDESPAYHQKGRRTTAQEFWGVVDEAELRYLSEHFVKLYEPLGLAIPDFDDWLTYQKRHVMQTLSGERAPESLFWIALRFFVGQRNPYFDLAEWVIRTYEERVVEPEAKLAVRYIAAFSSFGIAVPLVPLLRSVGTSRVLDTSIIPTLRSVSESEDLLQWGDSEEYLHDQTVSFKHRLISIQLLNQLGVNSWEKRLREVWGLLRTLEASPLADTWLVEALVFEALRVERLDATMRERLSVLLETLDHIPSVIGGRSTPTQHHWARALGFKARQSADLDDKVLLYSEALEKLALACELAESDRGREHPRNIYNSLGVMRSELSRTLRDAGQIERAETLWQSAASAFDLALRYGSDNFVVLSAYANRLIEHANEIKETPEALNEIASALSFLAQAEESALLGDSLSIDDAAYIERERNNAWEVIDPERAECHIEDLITQGNEIGLLLKAYRTLRHIDRHDWEAGNCQGAIERL